MKLKILDNYLQNGGEKPYLRDIRIYIQSPRLIC